MSTELAVMVYYKASGFGSAPELRWEYLQDLKGELRENYITSIQDTGGPQAGGILDTVVEIFTNHAFSELTEIVKDGLLFDLIFNGKNSILLKPLVKAFQKIESTTLCWDYTQVRFYFDDTVIIIYGASKLFTSVVGSVFPKLIEHAQYLNLEEYGLPSRICLPIRKMDWGDGRDSWVTPEGDGEDYTAQDCLTFWGLEYGSRHNRKIYDYKKKQVLDLEWR